MISASPRSSPAIITMTGTAGLAPIGPRDRRGHRAGASAK
jgi:hypothetical protein